MPGLWPVPVQSNGRIKQQEYAMTLITRVFTSPYATPEGLGKLHTSVVALQRELVTPCLCRLQTRRFPGQSGWRIDAHSPRSREEILHLLPDPKTKTPPPESLLQTTLSLSTV